MASFAAGTPAGQPSAQPSVLRQRLDHVLRRELGAGAQVVSLQEDGERRLRGLAVSAGRILSFVLDAQEQRLRTRPLFDLLEHSCRR
jgi:hypothetical protein